MHIVLVAGELIAAGKYRVDREIGRGGMGIVVAATHLQLRQQIALKFLLPELAANQELVRRFVREARASAQLRGEHVCRVSDVGTADNGAPYIVMELLAGRDLASLLAANGPLPVAQTADYILQACVGLAEAHALGIVHRDLKPENLFWTRRPDGAPLIKVLDFGIAKPQRDQTSSSTLAGSVLGTPSYMSPEQLRSSDVDARSDVWSIGVILHELATGRRPFTGGSLADLASNITTTPAPPLGGRIPSGFERLVHRCLAKDPARRYADVAQLAQALAAYAGPAGQDMADAVSRLLGSTQSTTVRDDGSNLRGGTNGSVWTTMRSGVSWLVTDSSGSRRRGVLAGAAVTALLGAVMTVVLARCSGTTDTDASPATAAVATANPPVDAALRPDNAANPPATTATPPVEVATASANVATPPAGATTPPADAATLPANGAPPPVDVAAPPAISEPRDAGTDAAHGAGSSVPGHGKRMAGNPRNMRNDGQPDIKPKVEWSETPE